MAASTLGWTRQGHVAPYVVDALHGVGVAKPCHQGGEIPGVHQAVPVPVLSLRARCPEHAHNSGGVRPQVVLHLLLDHVICEDLVEGGVANFAVGISGLQSAFHNIRGIALQPSICSFHNFRNFQIYFHNFGIKNFVRVCLLYIFFKTV